MDTRAQKRTLASLFDESGDANPGPPRSRRLYQAFPQSAPSREVRNLATWRDIQERNENVYSSFRQFLNEPESLLPRVMTAEEFQQRLPKLSAEQQAYMDSRMAEYDAISAGERDDELDLSDWENWVEEGGAPLDEEDLREIVETRELQNLPDLPMDLEDLSPILAPPLPASDPDEDDMDIVDSEEQRRRIMPSKLIFFLLFSFRWHAVVRQDEDTLVDLHVDQ